jgi:hypothetical protein
MILSFLIFIIFRIRILISKIIPIFQNKLSLLQIMMKNLINLIFYVKPEEEAEFFSKFVNELLTTEK